MKMGKRTATPGLFRTSDGFNLRVVVKVGSLRIERTKRLKGVPESDALIALHRLRARAREEAEAKILRGYLPAAMSEADVRALVREAVAGGADHMGAVMRRIMPRIKGRFDGRDASRIVREELGP